MDNITANQVLWSLVGIPGALAWFAMGLGWLLEPRLAVEVAPLMWAFWAAGGWYAMLMVIFGGWWGLLFLAALS